MDEAIHEADVVVALVAHSEYRALPRPQGKIVVDTIGLWR